MKRQPKSGGPRDAGIQRVRDAFEALNREELKQQTADTRRETPLRDAARKVQRKLRDFLGDPRHLIWNRAPGITAPMHRGAHHAPRRRGQPARDEEEKKGGAPLHGLYDLNQDPSSPQRRELLEDFTNNFLRDYGPGGIGRRHDREPLNVYPQYIDRVFSSYPPLPPINLYDDHQNIVEQVEAMRLKPERGLWRYILKGDNKMNDTNLGRFIAIRRSD